MENKKVEVKCDLIIDKIDRIIDDLSPNEMILVIELLIKELSNILEIYNKIF